MWTTPYPAILDTGPVTSAPRIAKIQSILRTLNPLAIGAGFGGLLLDLIAPRPKPRPGKPPEFPARGAST